MSSVVVESHFSARAISNLLGSYVITRYLILLFRLVLDSGDAIQLYAIVKIMVCSMYCYAKQGVCYVDSQLGDAWTLGARANRAARTTAAHSISRCWPPF